MSDAVLTRPVRMGVVCTGAEGYDERPSPFHGYCDVSARSWGFESAAAVVKEVDVSSPSVVRRRGTALRALIALVAALAILLPVTALAAPPDGTPRVDLWLTILHNNDGESRLIDAGPGLEQYGGVARFKTVVDNLRAEALEGKPKYPGSRRGVLMLSSGDNFLAGAQFNASLTKGVPFYDSIAMDLIRYDAIAIGNHEFDFGPDVLADFIRGFETKVPFLSANLDVSGEPELEALRREGRIAKSTIVRTRGAAIGIIGATTPQLPNISSPRNVVALGDVAGAIQAEVTKLQRQRVDKIILISHLQSVAQDLALAPMLTGIDVMIAGGGDEVLANEGDLLVPGDTRSPDLPYPLTATGKDGRTIPVVTTPGNYRYVGRLIVGFDRAGDLVAIDDDSGPVRVVGFPPATDVPPPDAVEADPIVQRLVVDPVAEYVEELANLILAQSSVPLNGQRGTVDASQTPITPGVRNSETNLGNLTADSMLWQAQRQAGAFGVDSPQVALQNGGGIRNETIIPPGPISVLNTFEILAFSNFVSVMEDLSAAHFKALLETSVSEIGNGRFGQWAGVRFSYDPTAQKRDIDGRTCAVSDPGSRVVDVWVDGVQVFSNGTFVGSAGWTVDIATNDFTFRGGDCYDFQGKTFTTVGVTYQQALANYLEAPTSSGGLGGVISATDYPAGGEGRIVRLP